MLKAILLAGFSLAAALACPGAPREWYVDATSPGGDGSSWARAWTSIDQVQGVGPGEIVNVSGGPTGKSLEYRMEKGFVPVRTGTPEERVIYRIGQDPLHNGTAVFVDVGARMEWIGPRANLVITGDAGDGEPHFELRCWHAVSNAPFSVNVRLAYIRARDVDRVGDFNPTRGLEIDHCDFRVTDPTADHGLYAKVQGTTWDDSSFHDNILQIPNSGRGDGADGLQWVGCGFSIYRNHISGYVTGYHGGQHQDGWQAIGDDSYIKIYDNHFENIANYAVFGDAYSGGFEHLHVHGNVIVLTDPRVVASDSPQGIVVGPDGGAFRHLHRYPVFTDVVISNNVIADYGRHAAINLHNNTDQASVFIDCVIANNVAVNCPLGGAAPQVVRAGNQVLSTSEAKAVFASYQPFDENNDFHLSTKDNLLHGRGTSVMRLLGDRVGESAQVGPAVWDVGAYPFGGSSGPTY